MAKTGEDEVRERARAKEIMFGKREIEEEEEEGLVFCNEHEDLVMMLVLGR